tara:strand:- start:52 stop:816 length:765 start_codon:yes stop_codon:yes gene_type:complete
MTAEEQTLTMDETTPESGQFSEEEMDSLKVGEEMYNEQEGLLAGKYQNAQELEKGYIELEKKLGETSEETTEETTDQAEPNEDEPDGTFVLDKLWDERESGFTDETLTELAQTNPGELAKAYLQLRANGPETPGLSESDITGLKNEVGGEDSYNQMVSWAEQNLTQDEQAMFDGVVDRGDPVACFFAIKVLESRYLDAVGTEGRLIQGKPPSSGGTQFRSQAELVKAMSDPRYDRDPAYRRDIQEKLERSEVNF